MLVRYHCFYQTSLLSNPSAWCRHCLLIRVVSCHLLWKQSNEICTLSCNWHHKKWCRGIVKCSIFYARFRGRTWSSSENRDSCNCFLSSPSSQILPHFSKLLLPFNIKYSTVFHFHRLFISASVSWLSQYCLSPWLAAWVPCWTQDVVLPI